MKVLRFVAVLAAWTWAVQAEADLLMQNDAFPRGFNDFAQANGKPARMKLKFASTSSVGLLGTTKIGKFVYDLDGCLLVTGVSKGANQVIDTVFAANSACALPGKLDDLVLLARYLGSLATPTSARHASEETIVQAFKTAERTHKQQTVTVGSLELDIDLSNAIGWAMRAH